MDYLRQPLGFKIRKVARYVRMYGLWRTWVKVQAQRHMVRRYAALPPSADDCRPDQRVALVGCGNCGYSMLAWYLTKRYGRVLGACMDVVPERAASLAGRYGVPVHTTDFGRILDNFRLRMLYIASNHASHAGYAIEALERGMDVYIEKPHVVSEEELWLLREAMLRSPGKVFLGFNRPVSRFGRIIAESLGREEGPGVYNWFVAGHAIDQDHWYFSPEEGGRVLGNLCHWTDFLLRLVPDNPFPIRILPARAAKSDTDIAVTYVFGDGTVGCVTFSSKGHTFEGVKERFSGHRGNCLIAMDDFASLTVDVNERKQRFRNRLRDHGHGENVRLAYETSLGRFPYDAARQLRYVWNTGMLFLKTREALERNEVIVLEDYEATTRHSPPGPRAAWEARESAHAARLPRREPARAG